MYYIAKNTICQVKNINGKVSLPLKNSGSCISSAGNGVRLPTCDQSEGVIQEPILFTPSDGIESRLLGKRGERGERGEMVESLGKWLCGWDWEWWVSLTFHYDKVGIIWSCKRWQKWIQRLRKQIGHRVEFVRVTEYQLRDAIHFHALMLNTDGYMRLRARDLWCNDMKNGYARVLPYDPNKGAGYYISKYIVKEFGDIQFSRNLLKYRRVDLNEAKKELETSQPGLKLFNIEVKKVAHPKGSRVSRLKPKRKQQRNS